MFFLACWAFLPFFYFQYLNIGPIYFPFLYSKLKHGCMINWQKVMLQKLESCRDMAICSSDFLYLLLFQELSKLVIKHWWISWGYFCLLFFLLHNYPEFYGQISEHNLNSRHATSLKSTFRSPVLSPHVFRLQVMEQGEVIFLLL